ncbi:hypothetical protein KFL_002580010 [Klebsormidium nitens]|uniref:Uncharacterized protein n=1 Tax=Klebsormidium nitens TaxID=105231 RepID=A0A1Y1I7E2_KLENI|nr:hypothetical protein KFL_002580010 [Klebsormidium nitens]|eukprot:GAQ85852.1 hypothetical protein KFL_002580010 [Klebsormidium nitens]
MVKREKQQALPEQEEPERNEEEKSSEEESKGSEEVPAKDTLMASDNEGWIQVGDGKKIGKRTNIQRLGYKGKRGGPNKGKKNGSGLAIRRRRRSAS